MLYEEKINRGGDQRRLDGMKKVDGGTWCGVVQTRWHRDLRDRSEDDLGLRRSWMKTRMASIDDLRELLLYVARKVDVGSRA